MSPFKANKPPSPAWFRQAGFCRHSGLPVAFPEVFVSPHADSSYRVELARLGEKILLVRAAGYVRSHEISDSIEFTDAFILTHFEEKGGIVIIEDYAAVKGADSKARKIYFDYFINSGIFLGGIIYNVPLLFKISFNMAKRLHMKAKPVYMANTYEQALDIALDLLRGGPLESSGAAPAGSTGSTGHIHRRLKVLALNMMDRFRILPTRLYSEAVLDYIYSIDWQKDGRNQFEIRVPSNQYLKSVLDGISFIKSEIDALLLQKDKAEAELLDYQSRLKKLSVQLSMAEERQRRELASQLHEKIGQDLFVAYMQISAMEKSGEFGKLAEVKAHIQKIIRETKTLTFDLSPPVLYDFGIREALESLAESVNSKYGLAVWPRFEGDMDHLSDEIKIILYRSINELIHNSVKHAHSEQIRICIKNCRQCLQVEVSDDGRGFALPSAGEGFGLFDIREKMSHLGGHMEIRSAPGKGTTVCLSVPLPEAVAGTDRAGKTVKM